MKITFQKSLLLLPLFALFWMCKPSQQDRPNYGLLYEKQRIRLDIEAVAWKDTLALQIVLPPNSLSDSFSLQYVFKNTASATTSEAGIPHILAGNKLRRNEMGFYVQIPIHPSSQSRFMSLQLTDLKYKQQLKRSIPIAQLSPQIPHLQRANKLIINHFSRKSESLHFYQPQQKKVWVYRIPYPFAPALPPMQTQASERRAVLTPDSVFALQSDYHFYLSKPALYFFQYDTSRLDGYALRVMDEDFPKYVQAENLIQPLIYISTDAEVTALLNHPTPKLALDAYWLKLSGGSETIAKKMIRSFYRRVEDSNRRFTGYKAGWKTDRGMIYILFGQPDQLIQEADGELWHYWGGDMQFSFRFLKKKNNFTVTHYELLRDTRYKGIWYSTVEAWRNPESWIETGE